MADPTPAELAKKLRNRERSNRSLNGDWFQHEADTFRAAADALDRLAALEASLTDEWRAQEAPIEEADPDRGIAESVVRDGYGPLLHRRVTPWEVVPDAE